MNKLGAALAKPVAHDDFALTVHFTMPNGDALYHEAIERFANLFQRAGEIGLLEPAAATLATATPDGAPSARVVLIRGFDERGFVFFTNSHSRKGEELTVNPRAALCFHWDALREQVRVEGAAQQVAAEESDAYWNGRPRDSQIASAASDQSARLADRSELERRIEELARQYEDKTVPRPDHWLGYRIVPTRIEFWSSRDARLHDRVVYEQIDSGWSRYLLHP